MFEQDAKLYMSRSKVERQSHVDLSDACMEIGGDSKDFRALLAHLVKTRIFGMKDKVQCCHACHNSKCSNPKHLYWGTPSENRFDAIANGAKISRGKRPYTKRPNISKALKGKTKSLEHRQALSKATKEFYKDPTALKKQQDFLETIRAKRKFA